MFGIKKPAVAQDMEVDGDSSKTPKIDKLASMPWVEKYRPKKVDEVVYQEEVVAVLKKCLSGSDFPNLLFYGPSGTGKTSTILALAREMFGPLFKERVLELNASDERGINIVREKIKKFAQQTASAKRTDGSGCIPLKIIILDEADSMTTQAQSALRRTMEKESKSTRFCLICNYVSRIIEPIASRCSKFRFKPLRQDLILRKLEEICEAENIKVADSSALEEVIRIAEGDLRKAIMLLQSLHRLKANLEDNEITLADVQEVSGYIPDKWIKRLVKVCKKNNTEEAAGFVKEIVYEGYSASQCLLQLHDWVLADDNDQLNDAQKAIILDKIAETDHQLLEGANEYTQLLNIAVVMMQAFEK